MIFLVGMCSSQLFFEFELFEFCINGFESSILRIEEKNRASSSFHDKVQSSVLSFVEFFFELFFKYEF